MASFAMDSVLNKLRNTVTTVTSTVQQLSVVLPGNPVTREYEINQPQIASAGPGLLWKVYSGFKKSTKQEASIFIFEKKQLEKWNRKDRDAMVEILKKGVQQLTKLKHPRILTVQYALEESRDSLAFASEPVVASLANVLDVNGNGGGDRDGIAKKYDLHEMEIKHGLLQICEGLTFLHRDAKMLHGNICPESIIISEQGSWKIFGLDFCNAAAPAIAGAGAEGPTWTCKEYEADGQELAQQSLDYMAPEYSSTTASCSSASDMFSLGLVAYTAFNKGHKLIHCNGNWHKHKQYLIRFETLTENELKCIPNEMRYFERRLLNSDPSQRPDSHEFSKLESLRDEGVRTLIFLDSMFQMDNLQKSKFYKGLGEILPQLPQRIRVQRVVPSLAQEFVNPSMVPFVLPNVLRIAEWATNDEYVRYVLPHLRVVLKLREPVQILFIFMKYMELLLQKTPPDITKSDVLPLIYDSLESDSPQVQELCLSIIPSFAALIDFPAMKNSLLPRIKKLCLNTQSLSVRVNCLVTLGKILDHLDKWLVIDVVLPFLGEIPSREPAVVMGIVGIIKLAATHKKLGLTREIIANRVLPFLFPLTIENGLTLQQFNTIMTFVYELIKMVETEQKAKLEEVGAVVREQMLNKAELTPASSNVNASDDLEDFFAEVTSSYSKSKSPSMPKSNSTSFGGTNANKNFGSGSSSSQRSTALTPTPKPLAPPPSMSHSQSSNAIASSKDLTSTLINSNLNQMSLGPSVTQQQRPAAPSQFPMQMQWPQQQQQQVRFPVQGGMSNSLSLNSMAPNANGGNWSTAPTPMGMAGPNYNLSQPSSGAPFGGMSLSPGAPRMNMNGANASNTNASKKVLSKQEIDDFLNFK